MLGVYICKDCGLVQLKNPAKLKQQLKEKKLSHADCPKCGGVVLEADVSYAKYTQLSEKEREMLVKRHMEEKGQEPLEKSCAEETERELLAACAEEAEQELLTAACVEEMEQEPLLKSHAEKEKHENIKKVLITGANGQLGHSLNKIIKEFAAQENGYEGYKKHKYEVFNTSRSESSGDYPVTVLDITSKEAVDAMVKNVCPDLIINCAAHTGVDLCETQEEAAYAMNALGPKYLAEAAKEAGAVFVQVSTDYVFSGDKEGAYLEEDETNPQSVYGRTKLAGEEFTKAAGGKYFIVRTAWLYGEGKNFVRTMLRLAKDHDKLTVVNDQTGTPTSTDELARAILFLADRSEYGIYHATCEGSVTWYGFAKKIFEYAGKEIEVLPVTSEEYKTAAKRPKNSVLENRKLNALSEFRMKDWQSALKEYLKEQDC